MARDKDGKLKKGVTIHKSMERKRITENYTTSMIRGNNRMNDVTKWFDRFETELMYEDYIEEEKDFIKKKSEKIDSDILSSITRRVTKEVGDAGVVKTFPEIVINRFGGVSKFVKAAKGMGLSISLQAVYKWLKLGDFPPRAKDMVMTVARFKGVLVLNEEHALTKLKASERIEDKGALKKEQDFKFYVTKRYEDIIALYGNKMSGLKRKKLDEKYNLLKAELDHKIEEYKKEIIETRETLKDEINID
jgi:hypothetical protein